MTRYELTEYRNEVYGRTLTQIRALVDLPEFGVAAGNLGGWIESESNFPRSSCGWIRQGAKVMHGGVMHGGAMHGGVMHGGAMLGGVMRGGVMRGGVMHGGAMHGGVMHGGAMLGGVMRGGVMRGGEMRGGEMLGGVMTRDSLFIAGLRWPVHVNDSHMTIGCQSHALAKWWKFSDALIAKMDRDALEFWRAHKATLQALCAATGRDAG